MQKVFAIDIHRGREYEKIRIFSMFNLVASGLVESV